ncbi:MAG: LytR C-terminal domain-containing protein [Candidatus Zixiibacteriota bacterium]
MTDNTRPDHSRIVVVLRKAAHIWTNSRTVEFVLMIACGFVLVGVGLTLVEITTGHSQTMGEPPVVIQVELVNGTDDPELAGQVAQRLKSVSGPNVKIEIALTRRIEWVAVRRSVLISRVHDLFAARLLAKEIGMDESEVVFKTKPGGDDRITVTLVMGADISDMLSAQLPSKES